MAEQEQIKAVWISIRKRLSEQPAHFNSSKTIAMLDLCLESDELQLLVPYVSLGRLCLSQNTNKIGHYTYDCPCMYINKNRYTVSTYDNLNKWFFDTPQEAVDYVRQNIPPTDAV